MSEFDLIANYFTGVGVSRDDVLVDVGDDCALLSVPAGRELAVSIDTLVAGVHFLPVAIPNHLAGNPWRSALATWPRSALSRRGRRWR